MCGQDGENGLAFWKASLPDTELACPEETTARGWSLAQQGLATRPSLAAGQDGFYQELKEHVTS